MSDVVKPLTIEQLMDQKVEDLSGGELQRVELCLCLGKVCVLLHLDAITISNYFSFCSNSCVTVNTTQNSRYSYCLVCNSK